MNKKLINLIFVCIALAMGVACFVLCLLGKGSIKDLFSMLSIAVICLSISKLTNINKEK